MGMPTASYLGNGFAHLIGVISLTVWSVLALWDRVLRRRDPGQLHQTFDKAQHDLWSLSSEAETQLGLRHHFLSLTRCQLHYLSPPGAKHEQSDLIIFLHGFPDSCHIFAGLLRSPLAYHAHVVALDLPGFGGSDGLPAYGADGVLNVISAAIVLLQERFLGNEPRGRGQCIVVGHDWGSVVASRLAMETRGLIDRVVLANGVVPGLFSSNVRSGVIDCRRALGTWWRDGSSTAALGEAKEAIRPVLAQMVKSNYIFVFRLPFFGMKWFSFVIEYLLSVCHRAAAQSEAEAWSRWSWASSVGPGVAECTKPRNGSAYGQSVLDRALNHPQGDWDTRLRLYREDLFSGRWNLREPDVAAHGVEMVSRDSEAKQFQCPASIVFGVGDFALDHRICVRGVEKLFRAARAKQSDESQIILIEDCGHWSPLEEHGSSVLSELLLEILGIDGQAGGDLTKQQSQIRRSDFK